MLRKKIFENFKKLVPKISDTEMIALNSGTTSIDRDISFNIFFGERECFEISSKIVVFTFLRFSNRAGRGDTRKHKKMKE